MKLTEEVTGFALPDNVNFDTVIVSNVMSNLRRGKAADIDGLMAEHLIFSHPILSVILSKLFNLHDVVFPTRASWL